MIRQFPFETLLESTTDLDLPYKLRWKGSRISQKLCVTKEDREAR